METDAFLVGQTLAGDQRAFTCLINKYQSIIFALCLANVKNPQDAEELAQDIFVRAYFKLSQLKDGRKFFQWLKKIAQNECKMYLRQPKPPVITLEDCSKLASKFQVEEQMLRQELLEAVMDAIESLPQKDKEVIKAYVSGFSHRGLKKGTPMVNRIWVSYQKYGEAWFPKQSISESARIDEKGQEHLLHSKTQIETKNFRLNHTIPEEEFTVEIPEDAKIWVADLREFLSKKEFFKRYGLE